MKRMFKNYPSQSANYYILGSLKPPEMEKVELKPADPRATKQPKEWLDNMPVREGSKGPNAIEPNCGASAEL
jgi:hypothetical protein